MNSNSPEPALRDEELHALLDGQLDAAALEALQARLARDPAAQARVHAWRRQHELLRGLHAQVLTEPAPSTLRAAADNVAQARREGLRWARRGGMAASVFLSFALGWAVHGVWPQGARGLAANRNFVQQAVAAHAIYAPEVRHPVEVGAAQEEHLVQWLSKRLGRPLKLPHLGALGFELVGGRLLPAEDGARAQFMYQNATGLRVTLYLGSAPAALGQNAGQEFRYSQEGAVSSFYWIDEGQAYALSGPLERQQLLELAQAVYHQL